MKKYSFHPLKIFLLPLLISVIGSSPLPTLAAHKKAVPTHTRHSSTASLPRPSQVTIETSALHGATLGLLAWTISMLTTPLQGNHKKFINNNNKWELQASPIIVLLLSAAGGACAGHFYQAKLPHWKNKKLLLQLRNITAALVPLGLLFSNKVYPPQKESSMPPTLLPVLCGMILFLWSTELLRHYRNHRRSKRTAPITLLSSGLYGAGAGAMYTTMMLIFKGVNYLKTDHVPDKHNPFTFQSLGSTIVLGILVGELLGLLAGLAHKLWLHKTKRPLLYRNFSFALLSLIPAIVLDYGINKHFQSSALRYSATLFYLLGVEWLRSYQSQRSTSIPPTKKEKKNPWIIQPKTSALEGAMLGFVASISLFSSLSRYIEESNLFYIIYVCITSLGAVCLSGAGGWLSGLLHQKVLHKKITVPSIALQIHNLCSIGVPAILLVLVSVIFNEKKNFATASWLSLGTLVLFLVVREVMRYAEAHKHSRTPTVLGSIKQGTLAAIIGLLSFMIIKGKESSQVIGQAQIISYVLQNTLWGGVVGLFHKVWFSHKAASRFYRDALLAVGLGFAPFLNHKHTAAGLGAFISAWVYLGIAASLEGYCYPLPAAPQVLKSPTKEAPTAEPTKPSTKKATQKTTAKPSKGFSMDRYPITPRTSAVYGAAAGTIAWLVFMLTGCADYDSNYFDSSENKWILGFSTALIPSFAFTFLGTLGLSSLGGWLSGWLYEKKLRAFFSPLVALQLRNFLVGTTPGILLFLGSFMSEKHIPKKKYFFCFDDPQLASIYGVVALLLLCVLTEGLRYYRTSRNISLAQVTIASSAGHGLLTGIVGSSFFFFIDSFIDLLKNSEYQFVDFGYCMVLSGLVGLVCGTVAGLLHKFFFADKPSELLYRDISLWTLELIGFSCMIKLFDYSDLQDCLIPLGANMLITALYLWGVAWMKSYCIARARTSVAAPQVAQGPDQGSRHRGIHQALHKGTYPKDNHQASKGFSMDRYPITPRTSAVYGAAAGTIAWLVFMLMGCANNNCKATEGEDSRYNSKLFPAFLVTFLVNLGLSAGGGWLSGWLYERKFAALSYPFAALQLRNLLAGFIIPALLLLLGGFMITKKIMWNSYYLFYFLHSWKAAIYGIAALLLSWMITEAIRYYRISRSVSLAQVTIASSAGHGLLTGMGSFSFLFFIYNVLKKEKYESIELVLTTILFTLVGLVCGTVAGLLHKFFFAHRSSGLLYRDISLWTLEVIVYLLTSYMRSSRFKTIDFEDFLIPIGISALITALYLWGVAWMKNYCIARAKIPAPAAPQVLKSVKNEECKKESSKKENTKKSSSKKQSPETKTSPKTHNRPSDAKKMPKARKKTNPKRQKRNR